MIKAEYVKHEILVQHNTTKGVYIIIDKCLYKDYISDNWVAAVIYKNREDKKLYTRTLGNFIVSFSEFIVNAPESDNKHSNMPPENKDNIVDLNDKREADKLDTLISIKVDIGMTILKVKSTIALSTPESARYKSIAITKLEEAAHRINDAIELHKVDK